MITKEQREAFIKDYEALCVKHGLCIVTSEWANLSDLEDAKTTTVSGFNSNYDDMLKYLKEDF